MFRAVLFALGVLLLVAAPVAEHAVRPVIPAAVPGAITLLGLLSERYIYKPIRAQPPGPEWEMTAERFADPRSGQSVVVYFNPRTGERRYVANGNG